MSVLSYGNKGCCTSQCCMLKAKRWDAIVVTCNTRSLAESVKEELLLRQRIGCLPDDAILLCVDDPQEGLGSGGATLNALLVITEHLSARNNLTVVSSDILKDSRILIIHLGRFYSHDPCGRAFICLPVTTKDEEMTHVMTNFDALYNLVTNKFNSRSPPGVWVCSGDMILQLPLDAELKVETENVWKGVCCISVPADVHYACKHGVYKIGNQDSVDDIIFQGSEEEISGCTILKDQVSLVSGVVFISSETAGKLLSLHSWSPVDACTYMGLDSGEEPIQISLYFDILLCMASDVDHEDFVHGKRSCSFGHATTTKKYRNMETVRKLLWDCLRTTPISAVVVKSGTHQYLDIADSPRSYAEILKAPSLVAHPHYSSANHCFAFLKGNQDVSEKCIIINSIIGKNVKLNEGALISHSHLGGSFTIGRNSVIIGIDEQTSMEMSDIPDNSYILGCNITLAGVGNKKVFCSLWNCKEQSFSDDLSHLLDNTIEDEQPAECIPRNSFLRYAFKEAQPVPSCFQNTLKDASVEAQSKVLLTAKLYPILHPTHVIGVQDCLQFLSSHSTSLYFKRWKDSWRMSLQDILEHVDHKMEFRCRRNLSVLVACEKLKKYLSENFNIDLRPLYVLGVLSQRHDVILSALDEAALHCILIGKPHLCARVFSCISEVLAMVAGSEAGLRSGPAANREWQDALLLLNKQSFSDGVVALSKVRQKWMSNADSLIRSARHYERASHIFIRLTAASAAAFIRPMECPILGKNTWLVCESPARIDLSGGWSDTPPVCYENGGSVLNMALLIDGKRPIGTRVRRISEPVIKFCSLDSIAAPSVTWSVVEHFVDYCRPQAHGALIKACIILAEIVDLNSSKSLKTQLIEKYDGGLMIQTWSHLPRGSGMGTSSILAGTVITALFQAIGRIADVSSVIHAVVLAEQMLTTGGGWQDQVGGLVGGVKLGSSEACLPLHIKVESIGVAPGFVKFLNQRLKLIYTGSTRLARNVLQEVLRNWYAKKTEILTTCDGLVNNARNCRDAFIHGDPRALGECMNVYWKQKKVMAPGCEPLHCSKIMNSLQPKVLGQLLAGAGGGGFCVALFKDPITNDELSNMLKKIEGIPNVAVYDSCLDEVGAIVYKEFVGDAKAHDY